ncbi:MULTISPECIES: DUF2255 family protein [unclassified Agromyces]|uniref:DUF2255 family protein n=1 Tax=unclassified Agromyces TaxID=2639701 RepID=UPI0030147762
MRPWTAEELARIGDAEEIGIASSRADGSSRRHVTIWVARVGDRLFVRSAYGPGNGWYRLARASRQGRVRAAGIEHPARFIDVAADDPVHEALDAAHRDKYHRHPPRVVATVVGPAAAATTLRVEPGD